MKIGSSHIINERTRRPVLDASGQPATWENARWLERLTAPTRRAMLATAPNVPLVVHRWLNLTPDRGLAEMFATELLYKLLADKAPEHIRLAIAARRAVRPFGQRPRKVVR